MVLARARARVLVWVGGAAGAGAGAGAQDMIILFTIIIGFGAASHHFWHQASYGLFALTFWTYCTFYTSSADSRWHECGHGK